jgi:nitroreductase
MIRDCASPHRVAFPNGRAARGSLKTGNGSRQMTRQHEGFVLWRKILEVARFSPSPHNVQPWRVKLISEDLAELYIDRTRTLPSEDHTGCFLLSAMGMFLEAVELLAPQHGIRIESQIEQSPEWYAERISNSNEKGLLLFAHLRIFPGAEAVPVFPSSIFLSRRTCRISLRPEPVPDPALRVLSQLAEDWGHSYTHIVAEHDIEEILAHNIDAVFTDMNVAEYHDEITKWFRFTDRTASEHKDGLDWRCMNLSRTEFWISARTPRLLLFPPTRTLLKRRYRRQLGNIPSIGILSGDFFEVRNAVHSGRFLLRFWLEVTRLGLYLHPYGNMVTNELAEAWLRQKTGVSKAWLVFKLGFSDPPPGSYRRAVEDILIPQDDRTSE